jgi:hypothetical protein
MQVLGGISDLKVAHLCCTEFQIDQGAGVSQRPNCELAISVSFYLVFV